jgi:hypothetical protein
MAAGNSRKAETLGLKRLNPALPPEASAKAKAVVMELVAGEQRFSSVLGFILLSASPDR